MVSEAAEPQRLLVFRPTLGQGGADRVTRTLLEELPRERFRLALALVRAEGPWLADLPADVELHELGAASLWTAWLPLARLLRKTRPQILFSTSSGGNVTALVAHLLTGRRGRCVVSERNLSSHRLTSWRRRLLARLKRRLYPFADAHAAVSRAVGNDLVRSLAVDPANIHVVFNPVVSGSVREQAAAPVDHPWLGGGPALILGVGRLVPEKGFETMLHALVRVRERHPARLLILGEGPLRPHLEALATRLGIGDAVRLDGFDRNPFCFMARCDVFVLSSSVEGLPGALIQAMACGAAVVAAEFAGAREIVEDGRTGLLVPVGDDESLATAVTRLLENANERRRLAEAGQRASARFHTERVIPRYVEALVGRPAAPERAA